MTANEVGRREEARQFLEGLKECFSANWSLDEVKRKMEEFERAARSENPKLHEFGHETYFLREFVVPTVHAYLLKFPFAQLPSDACKALLAEGYAQFKGQASGTPASALKYPFTKQFSAVDKVVESWWNGSGGLACTANPDFALRFPCPYKVVGEMKYFRKGGIDAAKTELVRSVYQCFYYRGLPIVPEAEKRPAWDYEYACLLAYDASGNGTLTRAWESVGPKVKAACWNGANIFVMLLP